MHTDILFERPSFWSGLARVLDLRGNFTEYNVSPTPEEADCLALFADWRSVGHDLLAAADTAANDPQQMTLDFKPAEQ
jgi:hypothetical protein